MAAYESAGIDPVTRCIAGPNNDSEVRPYVADGKVYGTVDLNYQGLADGAIDLVKKLAAGESIPKMTYIDMIKVTKDNIGKWLAEAPAAFLPVALVLLLVIFLGREHLFPWIRQPVAGKAWWLNVGLLFGRDGFGLLLLTAAALALVYHSVQSDHSWIATRAAGNSNAKTISRRFVLRRYIPQRDRADL